MALVTAYLAHSVRRRAGRTASLPRALVRGLVAACTVIRETMTEAQDMRRECTRKHPFMDI